MPSSKSKPKQKPEQTPSADWSFEAIGTHWWIGIYQDTERQQLAAIRQAVDLRIDQFDRTYSRFRADSLVSRIAEQAGSYDFPADSTPLFGLYQKLYAATNGAVTPLIGQVLSDAGYDARYSLQPGKVVSPPAWDDVMTFTGTTLTTTVPLLLDFGAAGKGYLVDIVADLLRQHGVTSFCIDAGGDLRCQDAPSLRIGLEHPSDPEQAIGVAELTDGALCGSAGNRRAWAEYHHIINPFNLASPHHVQAVWVAAKDALTADGLTTALYFVVPDDLLKLFTFSYVMVYANNTMIFAEDFPGELFSEQANA